MRLLATLGAVITAWVTQPSTCGQNFSITYLVSNATSNQSLISIQSTGFGGVTTVGTPLNTTFVPDTNNTVQYLCPSTFNPGFGGTRYAVVIRVDTTTFTSSQFSIVAAPSPSRTSSSTPSMTPTLSLTPSMTPTPSMSNGSTATPSLSVTSSVTPSASVTVSATPSMTPTPRTVVDLGAIQSQAQTTTFTVVGGVLGGLAVLICILVGVAREIQRRERVARRLRMAKVSPERMKIYAVYSRQQTRQ